MIVVLDNIRSAHNVGAIFRTCDGAGVTELYLCGITPYPPHNKIPKTALGAEEMVKWRRFASTTEAVVDLHANGYTVYIVEQTASAKPFHQLDYPEKSAFVFGHEISGVDPDLQSLTPHHIQIPMFGQKNSLNVATTVGVVVYHVKLSHGT